MIGYVEANGAYPIGVAGGDPSQLEIPVEAGEGKVTVRAHQHAGERARGGDETERGFDRPGVGVGHAVARRQSSDGLPPKWHILVYTAPTRWGGFACSDEPRFS